MFLQTKTLEDINEKYQGLRQREAKDPLLQDGRY